MNVVVRCAGAEYEVALDTAGDEGTIGDLISPWFDLGTAVIAVDGRGIDLAVPVIEAGIGDGSILEVAAAAEPQRRGTLRGLTAGLAGSTWPLAAGAVSIGTAPADIEVADTPGHIRLLTSDAGEFSIRNPERLPVSIDGQDRSDPSLTVAPGSRIGFGQHRFELSAESISQPLRQRVFNRPPRAVVRRCPVVLELPHPPQEPAKAMRFGWGALIVPVVLGITMALLIHPRMAMFAIFSPAMLLANWFEDRRRLRRERKETGEAFRDALDRFSREVAGAYRHEMEERHRVAILPAEVKARSVRRDARLWERRPDHDDFMQVPLGTGCVPWNPKLQGTATAAATGVFSRYSELHDVPILIDLSGGAVTGIAGARGDVLAIARQAVLQAAVSHGPADLAISVFTENAADWDWAKWLPHVRIDGSGRRRLAGAESDVAQVVSLLPRGPDEQHSAVHHLVVVDLPDLSAGERGEIRDVLRAGKTTGVAGLALAPRPLNLPSVATTIVAVEPERTRVRFPDGDQVQLAAWRMSAGDARETSRGLARIIDPEAGTAGTGLPSRVHLSTLLAIRDKLDRAIATRWGQPSIGVTAPIGMGIDGVLSVDLVADGPHALLGGTTGAGKSELLRTLVAGLAATTSPVELNFVLVDYKGGSAFDACAALPHTVGLVTDLDEHLARRALTCLEAELRYREHKLRDIGATDIAAANGSGSYPLPRLLVVIDEFAALAKELPDFMAALVDVAQRGRSLGVHLLLATQRPNGVISDNIKANTNLRIALRVQDNADSIDVIGCADAAAIGRNQPGRGLARLGPRDVAPFQTALVTGRSLGNTAASSQVQPFVFAHEQPLPKRSECSEDTPTDLERIVAATVRVAAQQSLPAARLPWPEALPEAVARADLPAGADEYGGTVYALVDEPHRQRQVAATWSPASGNLLMYGLSGSGTTTALASMVTGLAEGNDPDGLHIYVLDFDDQALLPLRRLPHVGAVVGASERERQIRLLRRLSTELADRRHALAADPEALAGSPVIVTFLDNYSGFADAFEEPGDMTMRNLFIRLVADGPGVGMFTMATAKHPGDIPTRLASLVGSKLAFRLADRYDYNALGVPLVEPPATPGRAFESGSGRELQIALPHLEGLAAAMEVNRWGEPLVAPWAIEVLPHEVSVTDVIAAGRISTHQWFLPLGIGDSALSPAGLVLREGDHALITGPTRSGKSTALATLAAVAKAAKPEMSVSALLPRRSPLAHCDDVDNILGEEMLADFAEGSHLLLVDDAELVADNPHLSELVKVRRPGLHIVAAGSADAIRSLYGHWTQDVRRSRIGCALRPNIAADGDLWQTPLPRRGPERFPAGRGYLLADGLAELVQLGTR
jgi:S-DNA-T family DNA segregation ATPase FtsK/SpoIIIE